MELRIADRDNVCLFVVYGVGTIILVTGVTSDLVISVWLEMYAVSVFPVPSAVLG